MARFTAPDRACARHRSRSAPRTSGASQQAGATPPKPRRELRSGRRHGSETELPRSAWRLDQQQLVRPGTCPGASRVPGPSVGDDGRHPQHTYQILSKRPERAAADSQLSAVPRRGTGRFRQSWCLAEAIASLSASDNSLRNEAMFETAPCTSLAYSHIGSTAARRSAR